MTTERAVPYRIFVSYRRDDSPGHAGWLVECLNQAGKGVEVFRDVVTIEPGVDWQKTIQEAIRACDMFICVIGPEWFTSLQERQEAGSRDVAAEELRLGLKAGGASERIVVPVLVGKGEVPKPEDLPHDLTTLLDHNILSLRDEHWHSNLEPLMAKITSHWDAKRKGWPRSLNQLKGRDIVQRAWELRNPPILMGRRGGLAGADMQKDLNESLWPDQAYETEYHDSGIRSNWFYVRDFLAELEKRGAYPPVR